jgi:hypothetical protein
MIPSARLGWPPKVRLRKRVAAPSYLRRACGGDMSDFIPRGYAPLRDWLEAQSRERLPARWAFIEKFKATGHDGLLNTGLSTVEIMALMPGARGPRARKALRRAPSQLAQCLQSKHLLRQFSAFRDSLYAGDLTAVAIADDGSIGAIPSVFWGGSQAVGVVETGRLDGRKVLIRDCEQGKNRTEEIDAERSEPANARVIKEATDFLVAEREANPDWQPHSKDEYFRLMIVQFHGLTEWGARQAWGAASKICPKPGWGKRGARGRKKQTK